MALFWAAAATAFTAPRPAVLGCGAARSGREAFRSDVRMMASLPRNLKEMVEQLRGSVQNTLGARLSRVSVEMPVGFEYGVEGQKAKRKGGTKVLTADDVVRSNRELARLFVGMFEGTGLAPLVLFKSGAEAAAAKKMWDAPGLEARVQALVGESAAAAAVAAAAEASTAAASTRGGGGGFGGAAAGKGKGKGKRKGGKGKAASSAPPLTRVPPGAEVVVAVAPGDRQLRALREFCEESGMDRLVVVLNARLDDESSRLAEEEREFFSEEGDFVTAFSFLTQPLGTSDKSAATAGGDPVVLWRAYPDEWVFARKPALGPPQVLLQGETRPSADAMREAIAEGKSGGLLSGLGLPGF